MIGRLAGRVMAEEPDGAVILDVAGVGYDVTTPIGTLGRAERDATGSVVLHIHTHVREDALDLFGFASSEDRRVFRLLIGLPNVGPKTALGVLSALPVSELARAVDEGDVARLTRIPGIGKKSAERLVLELREKLLPLAPKRDAESPVAGTGHTDARRLILALTNMGYRPAEAERAVKSLADRVGQAPLADLLREALARLAP